MFFFLRDNWWFSTVLVSNGYPSSFIRKLAKTTRALQYVYIFYLIPENDKWADCVGLTMRKCMLLSENLMKEGKSMDFVSATTEYINCYKKADKYKCSAKMLDHYIQTMDVYYQHLQEDKKMVLPIIGWSQDGCLYRWFSLWLHQIVKSK